MAHLPSQLVSGFDPFAQSKTLFLPAPGTKGILLTRAGNGFHQRVKKFKNAHAALTWCELHQAAMIFLPVQNPAQN